MIRFKHDDSAPPRFAAVQSVRQVYDLAGVEEYPTNRAIYDKLVAGELFEIEVAEGDVPTAIKLLENVGLTLLTDDPEPAEAAAPDGRGVAIALMMMGEGNPGSAAAYASILARATGDSETYAEAIEDIVEVFPWVEGLLEKNGVEW